MEISISFIRIVQYIFANDNILIRTKVYFIDDGDGVDLLGVINAKKITQLRKQRGLNQYELADQANIAPSVVSRLERDLQGDFKISVLVSVAKALCVSVDSLLTDENQVVQPQLKPELESVIYELESQPEQVQRLAAGVLRGLLSSIENLNKD